MAITAGVLGWMRTQTRADRAALQLLQSRASESRQAGAWLAAREHTPRAWAYVARALEQRQEPDPGVREAYVYALGRSGEGSFFDTVSDVVQTDPGAYVRQAAWLAAARIDPERFRALPASVTPSDDPWDRIGRAAGWLEIGDLRGVDELLHWAVAGDAEQRRVADLALYRTVAPALEAAGRWPIEFTVREGELWPPALVAEVQSRCRGTDLQAIADDTCPHVQRAAPVRRNVARLDDARAHLTRWLFTR